MFKDILVICDAHAGHPAAVKPALKLAAEHGNPLTICHLISHEVAPMAAAATGAPVAVAPEIHMDEARMKELREKAGKQRSEINRQADAAALSIDWRQVEGVIDDLAGTVARLARVHDISILDGPRSEEGGAEWTIVLEELIRNSGRPCLIVPDGYNLDGPGERVQICWDGSASASRAVHESLPMLGQAHKVLIVALSDGDGKEETSGENLRAHLKRHGVEASVHKLSTDDASVTESLAGYAEAENCDLLIMGAYKQSWLRRIVFGSVTDETIRDPRLPVFVSH